MRCPDPRQPWKRKFGAHCGRAREFDKRSRDLEVARMRPGYSVFYSNGVLSRPSGAQRPSHGRWSRGCLENHRMVFVATPTGCCLMMDSKDATANRTNQCNPTHTPSGPGHKAGYTGSGTKPDLDNHSNQLNPNNAAYKK